MSGDPSAAALSEAQREQVHAYFAAFLSPAAAEEAAADLAQQVEDTDEVSVLAAAHRLLLDRVEVAPDVEVPVLVEDLGVGPGDVARITRLPVGGVEQVLARQGLGREDRIVFDDLSASTSGPASPPAPPLLQDRPRSRRLLVAVVALLVVAAGAVAALLVWGGGDDGASGCTTTPQEPVCLVDARVTDVVTASGPGAERHRFGPAEPVRLWFRFDRLEHGAPLQATFVWLRGDEALYSADFPLPQRSQANLTLLEAYREPGDYRVQVRVGDQLLVERAFSIVGS